MLLTFPCIENSTADGTTDSCIGNLVHPHVPPTERFQWSVIFRFCAFKYASSSNKLWIRDTCQKDGANQVFPNTYSIMSITTKSCIKGFLLKKVAPVIPLFTAVETARGPTGSPLTAP